MRDTRASRGMTHNPIDAEEVIELTKSSHHIILTGAAARTPNAPVYGVLLVKLQTLPQSDLFDKISACLDDGDTEEGLIFATGAALQEKDEIVAVYCGFESEKRGREMLEKVTKNCEESQM